MRSTPLVYFSFHDRGTFTSLAEDENASVADHAIESTTLFCAFKARTYFGLIRHVDLKTRMATTRQ